MDLPIDFVTRTKPLLGQEWESFTSALKEDIPVSIRLNAGKNINHAVPYPAVPWSERGYYLNERPFFTFDPLFHAGRYYVQEASSMFVGQVLKKYADNGIKVLDLCAAPGGKSTLLADMMAESDLLVSNEVIRSRANILSENIAKWGNPNVIVTNNDPAQIGKLKGFFDIILVDAPCSGEGMFRKDETAIEEWSVENVKLCKERQQRILGDIWPALKDGGILIYSTCTYNLEENEENVMWIRDELGAEVLPIDTKEGWGITHSFIEGVSAYRFLPHKTKGEGFFCAALRKTGSEEFVSKKRKQTKDRSSKVDLPSEYKNYVQDKDQYVFYQRKDSWYAFPSSLYADLQTVEPFLNIVSEGICLGEFKGKDFIPDHSLAMSTAMSTNAFPRCEVDWQTAIFYLRKEALVLPDQPKGYIILTYKGQPLGFVKNIGNRANNLYPQEWRIRSSNLPDKEVNVI